MPFYCTSRRVPVFTFHKIDPRFEWGVTRSTPVQFRKLLVFLKSRDYHTVSLNQIFDAGSELPERPVVLTFDDSYASVYHYAFPLLQEYGMRGTVFIITGFVNRPNTWDVNIGGVTFPHLTWSQISEMRRYGIEIGSHTVHHADLTRIPHRMMERELGDSREELENRLGCSIQYVSFPFGKYNDTVIDASLKAGYRKGCGCFVRRMDQKKCAESFVIERKSHYLIENLWEFRTKLSPGVLFELENLKLRIINFCSRGTSLVKPTRFDTF